MTFTKREDYIPVYDENCVGKKMVIQYRHFNLKIKVV